MCDLFYFIFYENCPRWWFTCKGVLICTLILTWVPWDSGRGRRTDHRAKLSSSLAVAHNLNIVTFDHDNNITVSSVLALSFTAPLNEHLKLNNQQTYFAAVDPMVSFWFHLVVMNIMSYIGYWGLGMNWIKWTGLLHYKVKKLRMRGEAKRLVLENYIKTAQ